jgi:hypothetical protein
MNARAILAFAAALAVGGCASSELLVITEPPRQPEPRSQGKHHGANPAKTLGIPPGHLPAPGLCRIWIPGRPPGRQSPPGICSQLARNVPRGAWLVSREDEPRVRVSAYDGGRSGVVVSIAIYSASDGRLLGTD